MSNRSDQTVYYIALQSAIGLANRKVSKILYKYGTARNFIEAGENAYREIATSEKQLNRLKNIDLKRADKVLNHCERKGYTVLTPEAPEYPERLLRIPDFPLTLYIKGKLPNIDDEVAIAMVGTRKASNYGAKVAHIIGTGLAKAGALIVSGGALGIDSVAHKSALMNGAKTVAVLGCGLDSNYLRSNRELRDAISNNGALVSEFEPNIDASKFTFPVRNRIISGLCLGTVVIEAGAKSGSLITAEHALEQGRDVFVAPGSAISPSFEGTNKFLSEGAKPTFSAFDVLEEYTSLYPHRINLNAIPPLPSEISKYHDAQKQEQNVLTEDLSDTEKLNTNSENPFIPKVKKVLTQEVSEGARITYEKLDFEPITFDDLLKLTNLDSSVLARSLTELEIFGIIKADSGNKYSVKE